MGVDPIAALFTADETGFSASETSATDWRAVATGLRKSGADRSLRIGRYRLVERIGRGRQADVSRAEGERDAPRVVALKVLPAAEILRDPRRRASFAARPNAACR